MKAMILAAGEGRRMLPLTESMPKPLLEIHGKALVEHHIINLVAAGITDLVINLHYLGHIIEERLGNGAAYGANIVYSYEETLLETAGGIKHALPLIADEEFIVVSADIYTDYDFRDIASHELQTEAHLVMHANAEHHPLGDFLLDDGRLQKKSPDELGFTWMSIGKFKASCFAALSNGPNPLRQVFSTLIAQNEISAECYQGLWLDVGTPARLEKAREIEWLDGG